MLSPFLVLQILSIFLLTSALLNIGLGFFVWWQNKKSHLHIVFALLSFVLAIWLFGTYMMLKNCAQESWVIFWDRFLYKGVVWIPFIFYHFIIELTQKIKEKFYKNLLFIGYILGFIFFLISQTDYFVKDVFHYKWGCHTVAQIGHHLFLIPFLIYIQLAFYLLLDCLKKTQDLKLKNQTKALLIAFVLVFLASAQFLPAYKISIFPIGYFFPFIWLLIIAYAITRYQLLNIKVIAVDILAIAIIFTVLVFTIFSENITQFIGRGIFLIAVFIFGWLAIKGVHREVEEKERLAKAIIERTKELEKAKNIAEKRAKELEKRKEELEKVFKIIVGRELRMIELKQKIKELEEKLKNLKQI